MVVQITERCLCHFGACKIIQCQVIACRCLWHFWFPIHNRQINHYTDIGRNFYGNRTYTSQQLNYREIPYQLGYQALESIHKMVESKEFVYNSFLCAKMVDTLTVITTVTFRESYCIRQSVFLLI